VASYSVFPNDGLRVQPRLVRKVSNSDGITLWEDPPEVKEVLSQQTARTMMTFLQAVTAHGTGAAASELHHPLGGKTGTTSDYTDAWFLGFSPSVTCGVWVGFDSRESLGEKETGARAALPIWMAIMRQAIAGKDNEHFLGDESGEKTPLLQARLEVPAKPGMPAKNSVAATKSAVAAPEAAKPRIPNASFLPFHFSPAHNTVPAPSASAKAHVVPVPVKKPISH
jgi:penicillin-binding protein 1A